MTASNRTGFLLRVAKEFFIEKDGAEHRANELSTPSLILQLTLAVGGTVLLRYFNGPLRHSQQPPGRLRHL